MFTNIVVEGTILNCPARLMLGRNEKGPAFEGVLQWGGRKLSDSLMVLDDSMSDQFGGYVDDLLPDRLPGELMISYQHPFMVLGVQDKGVYFKVAKDGDSIALLFRFQMQARDRIGQDTSLLLQAMETAVRFFGIQEFLFYAQKGNTWLLSRLASGDSVGVQVPAEIRKCHFLTCARIRMEGDSIFVRAVRTLFGLEETELFVGAGRQQFMCIIRIPSFKTDFMESTDMYMLMEIGSKPAFIIKGSFHFSLIREITFHVDCGVRENAFELEALAQTEKPVPLFGPFSIGDTCLMIRVSAGLTFGMYTDLYIRNIRLFGALILRIQGSAVVPELLSAAVSDLSVPILLDNLLGTHISGIEVMDFIKIRGLPFKDLPPFPKEAIQNRDHEAVVEQFNSEVGDVSLKLDTTQVRMTPLGDGLDVTDQKRMRHYYIDKNGKLKLMAQFYYASDNTKLGEYTVERGLFICGVIEIFGKSFDVLFSFRENDGLLAYARIPSIDLGFLKIGPSQLDSGSDPMLPLAENSLVSQFAGEQRDGLVFFLSACKNNISFYFDGMVEFLTLFHVDARIIFCKGMVSVDLRVIWLSILQVSLHISVDYHRFTSGGFGFCLVVDTSRLTEKLRAVTQNIENAIHRLRNKIADARREIDRAQAHVNELYGQIRNFDRKIAECRQRIRDAAWYKKVFVAIAMGIEIGAFEMAKAGIYTAIGVATTALKVAKKVVELSGIVGEGVMRAVNAVIQGAMSLFYINYLKLAAKADREEQYFQAEIEFVALGKTYKLNKTIGIKAMQQSPDGVLSGVINDKLQPELDHIESGAFRSNWQRYRHVDYTVEQHCKRLDQAKSQLNSSLAMMTGMQNTYVAEFQTPMEEFDEMNVSLMDTLDQVEHVLATGAQAGDVSQLSASMGGLKRSVGYQEKKGVFRDEELAETKKLIAEYDEARILYDRVIAGLGNVQRQRKKFMEHHEAMNKETRSVCGECVIHGAEGDMAGVLMQVEKQMYENFPVDRSGTDFINLSREPLIRECFMEAERELGVTPSNEIQAMRSRSRKGNYKSRL